ncbi:MAG: choice-of-anchor D domain-containing protein, partial [Spartobacteria bacterium]|nr:choice-of-anchor D domain-containing protein [Spartobacteria bacterium]
MKSRRDATPGYPTMWKNPATTGYFTSPEKHRVSHTGNNAPSCSNGPSLSSLHPVCLRLSCVLLIGWGLICTPVSAATIRIAGGAWQANSQISATHLVVESDAQLSGAGTVHAATTIRGEVSPGNSLEDVGALSFDGDLTFDGGRFLCYAATSNSVDLLSVTGQVSGVATVAISRAGGALPNEHVIIAGAGDSDYASFDVSPSAGWQLGQSGSLDLWISAVPGIQVLGASGAPLASGEAPDAAKGTAFYPTPFGSALTNTFSITNDGIDTLIIDPSDLSDPTDFSIAGIPATVDIGTVSNFTVTYAPTTIGDHSAFVVFTNNAPDSPFTLNLAGSCYA